MGFGGDQLPLPLPLPPGAERHLPPPADAPCPYSDESRWAGRLPGAAAAVLALQRRFSVRPGLPGAVGEAVDPAAVDHWELRGGYFLRKAPRGGGEPRDILWFRWGGRGRLGGGGGGGGGARGELAFVGGGQEVGFGALGQASQGQSEPA